MATLDAFLRRLVEEGNLDLQLQLKKCNTVDDKHAAAIAKIEKDFAQVRVKEKTSKGFIVVIACCR